MLLRNELDGTLPLSRIDHVSFCARTSLVCGSRSSGGGSGARGTTGPTVSVAWRHFRVLYGVVCCGVEIRRSERGDVRKKCAVALRRQAKLYCNLLLLWRGRVRCIATRGKVGASERGWTMCKHQTERPPLGNSCDRARKGGRAKIVTLTFRAVGSSASASAAAAAARAFVSRSRAMVQ